MIYVEHVYLEYMNFEIINWSTTHNHNFVSRVNFSLLKNRHLESALTVAHSAVCAVKILTTIEKRIKQFNVNRFNFSFDIGYVYRYFITNIITKNMSLRE